MTILLHRRGVVGSGTGGGGGGNLPFYVDGTFDFRPDETQPYPGSYVAGDLLLAIAHYDGVPQALPDAPTGYVTIGKWTQAKATSATEVGFCMGAKIANTSSDPQGDWALSIWGVVNFFVFRNTSTPAANAVGQIDAIPATTVGTPITVEYADLNPLQSPNSNLVCGFANIAYTPADAPPGWVNRYEGDSSFSLQDSDGPLSGFAGYTGNAFDYLTTITFELK